MERKIIVKDTREIVANNISELRQSASMTQLALAQKLNYSDKAISKWERGESFPDIFMLKSIADLFGVSVDYLFTEDHTEALQRSAAVNRIVKRNRIILFRRCSCINNSIIIIHSFISSINPICTI